MTTRVLLISKIFTHPMTMGNSKAILAQVNSLQQLGCEVDFLYVQERGLGKGQKSQAKEIHRQMKDYWGDHLYYIYVGTIEKFFKSFLSYLRKYICDGHEGTYDRYPLKLTNYVKKLQNQKQYDACIVQYYYLTKLFRTVKFEKMACFTHDVFAYKNVIVNESCPWIDANQEARAMQLCTDVFAIQEEEKNYYRIITPQSRIYNVYTPYTYQETSYMGNHNIVFLSGNNIFNQNGLKWFVNDVFPIIRIKYQDARLIVAGGICKVIEGLYEDICGVELIGYVDNPIDLYKMGDVAINPVFQGTGLKIKTFEAISYGKATLVHPHSMAGIFNKDSAPLFASEKPEEWVSFLEKVWSNKEEVERLKREDKNYLSAMNKFIVEEYKRFLSAPN